MLAFLIDKFVFLFLVINPFAVLPIFMALTQQDSPSNQRRTAIKACIIALIILATFAFVGEGLLNALKISTPALQMAGGCLLLLTAIDMVVAKHSGMTSTTKDEAQEAESKADISVFPLAIPLLAGPGALTAVVMKMREVSDSWVLQGGIVMILVLLAGLTFMLFMCAASITRFLGVTGTNVMTRVFGIILASLAFEFILTGIKAGLFQTV